MTIEQRIAAIDPDALKWLEEQEHEFMRARACLFGETESREYELRGSGWYARLTAPGYLDCTEWDGPHESEETALVALYETFGD